MKQLAFIALLAGCSDLPARWTIAADGVAVEVTRAPFGYTVRDGGGQIVLRSRQNGKKDGYGALGWNSGRIEWGNIATLGYYTADPVLDVWRDSHEVTAATVRPDRLELALSGGVRVTFSLRASVLRVEATTTGKARVWEAAFVAPADEGYLGFGERYNKTNQRGMSLYAWPEEGGLSKGEAQPASATNPWPNGAGMTYYPVPFFLSTERYGFWLDSDWRNQFDLTSDQPDAWRVWHMGPSLAYEIHLPKSNDARPWPLSVIDSFTATTGRPMVPPAWSFGPRRRINRGSVVGGVPEVVAMRQQGLALTVADDNTHFQPDGGDVPVADQLGPWVRQNAALGVRTAGYYNPYFAKADSPISAQRDEGLANNYFLRKGDGTPSEVWLISGGPVTVYTVDFTSSAATNWFTDKFRRALDLGYSGWMYDFGEYVQPDVVTSTGVSGEEYHNRFPVEYDRAAHDALEQLAPGDWYYFSRSGYTGAQQYAPMVWSGDPDASFSDAEGIPAQVRAGINIGVSGVANWGSDIGGFKCQADGGQAADGELLTRWIEFGAMSSNMHDEDACTGGSGKATIWSSDDARAAWRTYAKLHTRLQPYMLALAGEAHTTGAPLVRHLYVEHPVAAMASVDDAFYFGPSLLVAPIVARGARSRTLLLPDGEWLDWRNGARVHGGGTVTLAAPLGELPLLLRDGHLVPLLDTSIETLDERPHPGVIGPAEVAGVLDVVGFVTRATQQAAFTLADGSGLSVDWSGGFAPPSSQKAGSEAELATCAACWLTQPLPDGVTRARVSATGAVGAGGLALQSTSSRRVRWDLYLVE
jgi:alpha-glucosidase (family GH31 glycosyl hydrolase)